MPLPSRKPIKALSVEISLETIEQQLYIGHARGPCSYLLDQNSSLLFLDGVPLGDIYRLLLDRGYRRHGFHLYRPDCNSCQECHTIRVPISDFTISKSQKRILKKSSGVIEIKIVDPEYSDYKLNLYNEYSSFQHGRPLDTNTKEGYQEFFLDSFLGKKTQELQMYFKRELCGVGIFDIIGDAVSAVYFYFNKKIAPFSPGTLNILMLLELGKKKGMSYFYPGYYIPECKAMNYKTNFAPYQIKQANELKWQKKGT